MVALVMVYIRPWLVYTKPLGIAAGVVTLPFYFLVDFSGISVVYLYHWKLLNRTFVRTTQPPRPEIDFSFVKIRFLDCVCVVLTKAYQSNISSGQCNLSLPTFTRPFLEPNKMGNKYKFRHHLSNHTVEYKQIRTVTNAISWLLLEFYAKFWGLKF